MTPEPRDRLYALLPAIYRARDAEQGEALRALLRIVERQADLLRRDVAQLHDDAFIETCAEWVVPYVGDLVGVDGLLGAADAPFSQRAFVANVLRHRRRKGTILVVERLARDVSGWRAHAVEFFQNLGWTQHLDHVRLEPSRTDARDPPAVDRVGTVNLRDLRLLDRLDGPFDRLAHTADVRRITDADGWHNVRNVGVFLWRLGSFPMVDVPPRRSDDHAWAFHFNATGNPAPLFTRPRDPGEGLSTPLDVPGPIRRVDFHEDLEAYEAKYGALPEEKRPRTTRYYGPGRSFDVRVGGESVPPWKVVCKDLSVWSEPPAGRVAVDVALGRLAFRSGEAPPPDDLAVAHAYGFSDAMGGGPYDRRGSLADAASLPWTVDVAEGAAVGTLQAAVSAWASAGKPRGRIRVLDNGRYGGLLAVDLPPHGALAIEAADGKRPSLRLIGDLAVRAPDEGAAFTLNGFLVEGGLALSGNVDLALAHVTLVPGRMLSDAGDPESPDRDSIVSTDERATELRVTIDRSVVGPIRLPGTAEALVVRDSIVDAPPVAGAPRPAIAADDAQARPGPPTTLERATILGPVRVRELHASETIFTGVVAVRRRQVGCVRFSHVPAGSRTPRRHRSQPELALAERARALGLGSPHDLPEAERSIVLARVRPRFTSRRYGDPGYAQLGATCADEIRTGAEDGSEMGAFARLRQPQREDAVLRRAKEYLPFGMEVGTIHVT